VKRLGKKETDPFQLQVTIQGPPANLMDVGYGVSQVLPIAVDCLTSEPGQMLLMQQPEVHLHPRGQAELGTFLANLVTARGNRFVVETHSDYLVNRVRLDIRDQKWLKPEDVCLLYCERAGAGVKVQEIHVDDQGNLLDAPPGYHRFLLNEEKRFFDG
jgi:predicted ATPase